MVQIWSRICKPFKENNSATKFCLLFAHVQCMSESSCKFQIPASNTVGGDAKLRAVQKSVTYVRMYVRMYGQV